ncbi:alpha/beta fold hydrolase [Rhodanobacter sp. DHB23]|uniref:alpha/beta hydrolase n=1 Tax=Rhodanobacter sp. DHB23 TaxID=2775923 RepID=UPI001782AD94|nr:alpha/beta fold hydrolase [Rhodanobacter sp. DHB23]MBD8871720.1 alpha/beta fold hydrolase [Rhodanobacter sp. DHB23]
MRGHIILSHGLDSSPDATKISALAARAEAQGWRTQRPDFRAHDGNGYADAVVPRVRQLREAMASCDTPPVLVGSSMGAFASALASLEAPVAALFLLATPPLVPGVAQVLDVRAGVPAVLVHGWRDEVCPASAVQAFAAQRRLPLLLLDDDHRLLASMGSITAQLDALLGALA